MKVKVVRLEESFLDKIYLPAIFAGLKLTITHFFKNFFGSKNIVTIQYPEVKRAIAQRWRGRHRLTRKDDGFIKCVACYMCETVCPSHCIHIDAAENEDKSAEKFPAVFDIDELRCIFCGLCVEACPKDAIRMDTGVISMAYGDRQSFDYTRNLLMDFHNENSLSKYKEVPLPKNQEEALPNSVGILPSDN